MEISTCSPHEDASSQPNLVNEAKKRRYHLHIDLDRDYEPVQKKNTHATLSRLDKENLRIIGKKHIDLWCAGHLYPTNPLTNAWPNFSNPTSLIKFAGDGHNGLLGYCNSLSSNADHLRHLNKISASQIESMVTFQKQCAEKVASQMETIKELEKILVNARKKKTTLGLRQRWRTPSNIETLKAGSGGVKRRIRAVKQMMHPDLENMDPLAVGNSYSSLVPPMAVKEMIACSKFKGVKRDIVQDFVGANVVNTLDIQKSMDDRGISRAGYSEIYKVITSKLKERKVSTSILPKPYRMRMARSSLNTKVSELVGEPYHIQEDFRLGERHVPFNSSNNIFFNVHILLIAMVKFYRISVEETNLLQVVIKLDECEILKQKKMERVTITLMNRALNPHLDGQGNIDKQHPDYFSVQSENNIWWLGSFEVDKEDHDLLYWVFNHTDIPSTIDMHERNEELHVEGFGDFRVEWHLAGDLKTLKCMFNIPGGANSRSPCIYCIEPASTLDPKAQGAKPSRDRHDPQLHPVLNIPLVRVHVCTLHALCRIVEKLVYLYIQFAWKLQPLEDQKEAIHKLETILSGIGLHGGKVKIEVDKKRSTSSHEVPIKPSIGGVKARRFLSFNGKHGKINENAGGSTITFGVWRSVHTAVKDHGDQGRARTRKAEVWKALDEVFRLCDKRIWQKQDHTIFKQALRDFGKNMKDAWTDQNITHYMHILYNHMPYFAKEYGSPAIWSTQGMEKSHYQARGAYFRHTQHGGGRFRANSLKEVHYWFYRRILSSTRQQQLSLELKQRTDVELESKQKRKHAWMSSQAQENLAKWRATRTRNNRSWIPRLENTSL